MGAAYSGLFRLGFCFLSLYGLGGIRLIRNLIKVHFVLVIIVFLRHNDTS